MLTLRAVPQDSACGRDAGTLLFRRPLGSLRLLPGVPHSRRFYGGSCFWEVKRSAIFSLAYDKICRRLFNVRLA